MTRWRRTSLSTMALPTTKPIILICLIMSVAQVRGHRAADNTDRTTTDASEIRRNRHSIPTIFKKEVVSNSALPHDGEKTSDLLEKSFVSDPKQFVQPKLLLARTTTHMSRVPADGTKMATKEDTTQDSFLESSSRSSRQRQEPSPTRLTLGDQREITNGVSTKGNADQAQKSLQFESEQDNKNLASLDERQLSNRKGSRKLKQIRLPKERLTINGQDVTKSFDVTDVPKSQSSDVNPTTTRLGQLFSRNPDQQYPQNNHMLGRCSDCNNNLDSSHNSFEEGIKQTRDVPETSREESPNSITKEENTSQLHERDLFIHTGQGRPRKNFLTVKNDADLYDKKDVVPLLQEQSYNHHNQNQSRLYQRESGSFCSAPCTTRGPFPKLTSSLPKWISSKCALDTGSQYLNCSYRGLLNVPDNPCPVNCTFGTIRTYNLQNNNVTTIHNCTFSRFEQLEVLDLSSNNLNSLEPRAFYGLKYLKDLNLWGNSLKMSAENFPPCIFSDLQSLKKLQINRNDDRIKSGGLDYPDEALSYLSRLTNLSMDGQYAKEFGPGFKSLTSLTHVILEGYLTGYCNISILTETTFQNVPYIRHLSIGSCYIVRIHPNAFSFLQQLESLDLNHNEDIDIIHLPHVFHSLRNITTLKHLNMKLVVNRYSIGICLDHQYLEDFPQHLESLNVQENNIEGIDRSVISRLSPTLKTLDVSGNRFVFGTYLKDLHLMENLIHLRINGGSFTYYLPGIYPYQLLREQNDQSNCTLYGGGALYYNNLTFVLRLPPRLETIEMNNAGLRYLLSALKIDSRNNLTKLSMAGNKFPKLIGPFIGFANLKHLDLSTCYVEKIKSTFFSHLQSLELLNLGANLLGDFLAQNAEPKLFSSLINLKTLNLTFNDISALPEDIFSGLDKMEYLLLYRNPLQRFDVSIIHMHNLQELDLDNTRIQLLDKATRDHIDMLSGKGQNVTVDVERCPIMCDCDNLDFLKWMQKSKSVDLTNSFSYVCTYPDTSLKAIMDGYADTIQVLGRECTSQEMLLFFVGAATSIMIITIICAILYRFRWNIRYLYYAAHSIYHGKISKTEETDFRYDAFICYDAQDDDFVLGKLSPELERRGLKMCIHSRDFIAGDYIASNIVKAVCSSRKTVVVLTRNLIDSYWCGFEMQMAKLESVYSGRSVLIFLLMETIPESVLGVDILYNIRNNTYIPYPDPLPDATSMGRLWDKLASDITS